MLITKILSLPLSIVVLFSGKCKGIIHRMLKLAKHWGPYFLGAWVVSWGLSANMYILLYGKSYWLALMLMFAIIGLICLAMTITSLVYGVRDALRRDKEQYNKDHPSPPKINYL